jgi:hypothetical protein
MVDMVFLIHVANTPANHAIHHRERLQRINLGYTGEDHSDMLRHIIHSLRAR